MPCRGISLGLVVDRMAMSRGFDVEMAWENGFVLNWNRQPPIAGCHPARKAGEVCIYTVFVVFPVLTYKY